MRAYVYQAALLCEACGVAKREALTAEGHGVADAEDESSYDSDDFPKGPYSDGGGESDSPQHCDHCQAFLENPLTVDGFRYVREAVREWLPECAETHGGKAVAVWAEFYGVLACDLDSDREERSTFASDTRRGEVSDDLGESPDQ